jgi:hypothetical protein
MDDPWHITVDVFPIDWGTVEGRKTLCGSLSQKIVRFQFFDGFVKSHVVKQSDVCKECLKILRRRDN